MKHSFFPIITLFLCLLFCSCEKIGDTYSSRLDGEWVVYKGECLFDGKVVSTGKSATDGFEGLIFSDRSMSIRDNGKWISFPYSISNGVITMTMLFMPVMMTVKSLTKTELILDIPLFSVNASSNGSLIDTFNGKDIYYHWDDMYESVYWYYSGKTPVVCAPIDEHDKDKGYKDTYRLYYKRLE